MSERARNERLHLRDQEPLAVPSPDVLPVAQTNGMPSMTALSGGVPPALREGWVPPRRPTVWLGSTGDTPIVGPFLAESESYADYVSDNPDVEPSIAALPPTDWYVVVYGCGSMNTHVKARTQGEAERLAVDGWRDGSLDFDETMFGHLDAHADPADVR